MSRRQFITVECNAVEVEVMGGSIRLRTSAASRAELELIPEDAAAIGLATSDVYTVRFCQEVDGATVARVVIMRGVVPAEARYEASFVAPSPARPGGDIGDKRTLVLQDRLWAFTDVAPGALVTRLRTTVDEELTYIATQIGAAGADTTTPGIEIPRIDYTREGGFWSPLFGYLSPFECLVFIDPASSVLRVIDSSTHVATMPRANRPLTPDDWNDMTGSVTPRSAETQYAVAYQTRAGDGSPSPVLVGRITDKDTTKNPDGSVTVEWIEEAEIDDDPTDPTNDPRLVKVAEGQTVISAGGVILSSVRTETRYQDDYTLEVAKITTTKEIVDLPGTGSTGAPITVETSTETRTYDDHPTLPGKKILRRARTTTAGWYVFVRTGGDEEREGLDIIATGAGLKELHWQGGIDTSASTNQSYKYGPISTVTESYRRSTGAKQVTVIRTETDEIRKKTRRSGSHTEIGDLTVEPASFARIEYVGTGGKTAKQIDATRIGRALGLEIARRRLARAGTSVKSLSVPLCVADYSRYRFGWVVEMSGAPWDLDGLYLCTEVDFDIRPPIPGATDPTVEQRLGLVSGW